MNWKLLLLIAIAAVALLDVAHSSRSEVKPCIAREGEPIVVRRGESRSVKLNPKTHHVTHFELPDGGLMVTFGPREQAVP